MNTGSRQLTLGISGAIAVTFGALGAHYLKEQATLGTITMDAFNGFETGVRYHLFHTLAMLVILVWQKSDNEKFLTRAYRLFLWGTALFSGSLYLLCTRQLWQAEWLRVLGPVTPIGGILLIAGWLSLAFVSFKKP